MQSILYIKKKLTSFFLQHDQQTCLLDFCIISYFKTLNFSMIQIMIKPSLVNHKVSISTDLV